MTLGEAAEQADALAEKGAERELAALRAEWDDEIEAAARSDDYRVRAQAYLAVAKFRFRQKMELLRRGLEDSSPAARGAALIALEGMTRQHPGEINRFRPLLHELVAHDPNATVRRLAAFTLKNGPPQPHTIQLLDGVAQNDEEDRDVRKAASQVAVLLTKKSRAK